MSSLPQHAPLPAKVRLPPEAVAAAHGEHSYHLQAWRYIAGTLAALPEIEVEFDSALGMPCWSAYELSVDGWRVAVDISDYILVDASAAGFEHWLRFTYTPLFAAFPHIGSFPITSFVDWVEYQRLRGELNYRAEGDTVLYSQQDYVGERLPSRKTERRQYVRRILSDRYGATLDSAWTSAELYWRRSAAAFVTVCVPGADNHHLDRSQHQLLGLGVCTISPDIFMAPLGERLVAGEHYVVCRDDYADLIERIEWCREHREACRRIGRQAQGFFQAHGTPRAIWQYVARRVRAS